MAEWKSSGLQIIVSVISSGLIVTFFGILINNIVKPDIQFDVEPIYPSCYPPESEILNISSECKSGLFTPEKLSNYSILENTLENKGIGTANNLRLTLYYPNADVIYNHTNYSDENVTSLKNENSHLLSINIPRLIQGSKIVVTTAIKGDYITEYNLKEKFSYRGEDFFINSSFIDNRNIVMATYDQGSKSYLPQDLPFDHPYKIPILLVALIIAIISIPIAFRHKAIRSSKDSKNRQNLFMIYMKIFQRLGTY